MGKLTLKPARSRGSSDTMEVAPLLDRAQDPTTPNFAIVAAASFAHCQNFSVAGLSRSLRAAMPTEMGIGSGVRRKSFTRLPKL